jgi:hypothetical protein
MFKKFSEYAPWFSHISQGSLTKRERLSMVDLLCLASLDQLFFILKILFTFLTKKLL